MSKPWNRKQRAKVVGKCDHEGCSSNAKSKFECLTCEKLGKEVRTVRTCRAHALWGQQQIRRHALVKHPSNILGAVGAALKGDEVF